MANKKKAAAKPAAKKAPASKPAARNTRAPAAAAAKEKPSLKEILDSADRAFTDMVKRYYALAVAYVQAVDIYGSAGKKAFTGRFPLTTNALRNLELVGRGRLLPQFSLCSNRFTVGLVELTNSLDIQYKLIGAAKGMIRCVGPDGRIVSKSFDELTSKESDIVLSVVAEGDEDLDPLALSDKITKRMAEARASFRHTSKPDYRIETKDGVAYVRFFKSVSYTAEALEKIVAKMKEYGQA